MFLRSVPGNIARGLSADRAYEGDNLFHKLRVAIKYFNFSLLVKLPDFFMIQKLSFISRL